MFYSTDYSFTILYREVLEGLRKLLSRSFLNYYPYIKCLTIGIKVRRAKLLSFSGTEREVSS